MCDFDYTSFISFFPLIAHNTLLQQLQRQQQQQHDQQQLEQQQRVRKEQTQKGELIISASARNHARSLNHKIDNNNQKTPHQ